MNEPKQEDAAQRANYWLNLAYREYRKKKNAQKRARKARKAKRSRNAASD